MLVLDLTLIATELSTTIPYLLTPCNFIYTQLNKHNSYFVIFIHFSGIKAGSFVVIKELKVDNSFQNIE